MKIYCKNYTNNKMAQLKTWVHGNDIQVLAPG